MSVYSSLGEGSSLIGSSVWDPLRAQWPPEAGVPGPLLLTPSAPREPRQVEDRGAGPRGRAALASRRRRRRRAAAERGASLRRMRSLRLLRRAAGTPVPPALRAELVCAPGPRGRGDAAAPAHCRWHLPPAPPARPPTPGPLPALPGHLVARPPRAGLSPRTRAGPARGSAKRLRGLEAAHERPSIFVFIS